MKRFFAAAIDDLAARSDGALVVLTAPAPLLDVERLLAPALPDEPILLWASPAIEPSGGAWSFAGWGEAARIDASGATRFEQIRRGADALFATLVERRHPGTGDAPPPRLHGGIAFRPEAQRAAPWAAFSDASFALPRWLYGRSGDRAFLRLAVRAGSSLDAAALAASLDRATARIDRAAQAPASASAARSGAGEARFERTSPAAWGAMIDDALARIRAHELEKVVPASLCRVASASAFDAGAAAARLGASYPECARFAFQRGEATFLGASPERLVDKRGLAVHTDALAGSAARRPGADEEAGRDLLRSDKDRREHHVVVEAIEAALRPSAREIRVPAAPIVRTLRNVHHLWTPIEATLARPLHVLDLVRALHPTPAVCGTPREAAIDWIAAHEAAPRGWYAGAVGWFDAAGDGAFSVAIRSGVLERREAWLYAGAGIVEGSDPSAEYAEARMKQSPMLAALGLLP